MSILFEIINIEFVVLICFVIAAIYLKLQPEKIILLFCHLLAIFLINDLLFDKYYFGDQVRYFEAARAIRYDNIFVDELIAIRKNKTVPFTGLIYAYFPMPFINSLISICMINFLIFLTIFAFLRKKLHSNSADYFLLLYPSLLLYTSMGLRDGIILVIMVFSLYNIILKDRYIIGLLLAYPLLFIKWQNLYMIVCTLTLYLIIKYGGRVIILGGIIFAVAASFSPDSIPYVREYYARIEIWRWAMFCDNYEYNWRLIEQIKHTYEPLSTGFELIFQVIKSFFHALLKPLPWESKNLFQVLQSMENVAVFGMIIVLNGIKTVNNVVRQKKLFLNIMLIVSMTVNGLVVFNFGAAVRYKFPFIVVYIVFFLYLLKYDRVLSGWSIKRDLSASFLAGNRKGDNQICIPK
jgi:hypothetical protein